MSDFITNAKRPEFDNLLKKIADYVLDYDVSKSKLAMTTAHHCLLDSLGCALLALEFPACTKLLGPVVPGATLTNGAKIIGTSYQLEPVHAAFNLGTMIRWLDFNDTWLAAEWGHPSDNLGSILMVADYLTRNGKMKTIKDILIAMIKAHEIQGILALNNSFNKVGLDHVLLVKIASTAVCTEMFGGTREQIINAISNAWIDGGALRTYRHTPNTGSRKSWAAGDATSRAVRHALIALTNEMGYPSALSAKNWGFQDVLFEDNQIVLQQDLGSYVMENILFKISFPAEFHAQTAIEAAITLHPQIINKIANIKKIVIQTQESGNKIINKTGPLDNPADRDHCIQYMVAIGLLKGSLVAEDYEDDFARRLEVDKLRDLMVVEELPRFTLEYLDPNKRSIGNAVQVFFKDGSTTGNISVDYPIGHKFRRKEGIPLLLNKFRANVKLRYDVKKAKQIISTLENYNALVNSDISSLTDLMAV